MADDKTKTDFKKAATVTVACKVPNGLLIRVGRMVPRTEAVPGGTRDYKIWEPLEQSVKINGPAHAFGVIPGYRIIGGYAMTENVPTEFFEEWLKQNADHDAVKRNLVFAHRSLDSSADDQAKDLRKNRSNLEPLNPVLKDDPRVPKRSNPNVTAPEKGNLKEVA